MKKEKRQDKNENTNEIGREYWKKKGKLIKKKEGIKKEK